MKKIDPGQTITILANIGVIAGIAFLAFEIRQNTAQMRAEAALGIHQDLQRLQESRYADPDFAELILRGEQDYASLDAVERERVGRYFISEINLADLVSALDEEGISNVSIRLVDITVNDYKSAPGRLQYLEAMGMLQRDFVFSGLRSEKFYKRLRDELTQ